ncbi:MAG: MBL fold metallo-hydrolase [Calditrichaeota bacterium]|nr:MAG: MBL fold metallo-hydrolase [Calditrichota bacterium]
MELTIIGSGTGALTAERGPSGYVLRHEHEIFLLDGGTGTLLKCLQAGVSYQDIDKLFYTHLHPDHTGDLIPFLFATKYTPGFIRRKRLEIFGPVGFKAFLARAVELYEMALLEGGYEISMQELDDSVVELESLVVETRRVKHSRNAIGYRFSGGDGVLVYSGDTDTCDAIIELARNADLLVLECSFPDDMKVEGHLTPREAGHIAAQAGAKRLILTHLYPVCVEEEILASCQQVFDGEVHIARDLQQLHL